MAFDPTNLTPAPWEAQECAVETPTLAGHCRALTVVCDAHNGRSDAARADAAFIAVARNAWDVMVRRGWHPVKNVDGTWGVMMPIDHLTTYRAGTFDEKLWRWPDPFTALVEAEAAYKANVEKVN